MARYHISPTTGNPNKCDAREGKCPFGVEAPHYASKEEARAGFEAAQGGAFSGGSSGGISRQAELAAAYEASKKSTWAGYAGKLDAKLAREAAAYAQEKNTMAAVHYEAVRPEKDFNLYLDYDGTGGDYVVQEKRAYTVALATGEFVRVEYEAGVSADFDGYWEYHPALATRYEVYPNARALAKNEPSVKQDMLRDLREEDVVLREEDRRYPGSSHLSYDHASAHDSRRAADRLLQHFADPYGVARAARLQQSSKRIKPETLMGKAYLGSDKSYVRAALAGRKELPREAQEQLATDPSARVRVALAQRSDLSAATVKTLLEQDKRSYDESRSVRHTLLANPALTPTVQLREAKKGNLEDLKALARNSSLSPEARAEIERRTDGLGVRLQWGVPFGQW